MLVAHMSDIHLGHSQFGLYEREKDVYEIFEEAIDKSILEHARLVILAGDLFHMPRPNGSSIIKLANELKKLKERSIPVCFVLGEHDINRAQDVPIPYIFDDLNLARHLSRTQALCINDVSIFGLDKERKTNMASLLQGLGTVQREMKRQKEKEGKVKKNILVLHQGLTDFNKFAGEIDSSDLPRGFDYYAMGHYHDHMEKRFDRLGGLLAYPGSLDLSPSEGIKEVDKGFFITDISGSEANTSWIKLENRRPQLVLSLDYGTIEEEVHHIIEEAEKYKKKPVLSLRVIGKQVDPKVVVSHLFKLKDSCLIYVWQLVDPQSQDSIVYQERPVDIDAELQKLAKDALGANDIAMFAINEILPLASQGDVSRTLELLWKVYSDNKFVSKEQAQERRRTP